MLVSQCHNSTWGLTCGRQTLPAPPPSTLSPLWCRAPLSCQPLCPAGPCGLLLAPQLHPPLSSRHQLGCPPAPSMLQFSSGLLGLISPSDHWPCPGPTSGLRAKCPGCLTSLLTVPALNLLMPPPRGTFTVSSFPTCATPRLCSLSTALRAFCFKSCGPRPHPLPQGCAEPRAPSFRLGFSGPVPPPLSSQLLSRIVLLERVFGAPTMPNGAHPPCVTSVKILPDFSGKMPPAPLGSSREASLGDAEPQVLHQEQARSSCRT